ncbi:MAG: phosphoribosylformylglycinamidine cyclo-ligase [Burkholderiales bacterium]|nr:phosphoribosylformylglycinamidine cyclo-ligase [Phycisphaerae bacterium]
MTDSAYAAAGVNYDRLDSFKRAAQQAARTTIGSLAAHGYREPESTRGESAYLIEADDHYLAHVEEGLGTKNLVADAMATLTGRCFYHAIAIDTVATIVNDLITCGALPISVAMHAAVGDSEWFADELRAAELARGFADGCRTAGAVWGGGETPTLKGIVESAAIVLAGSAVGRIAPKSNRIVGRVENGDAIIFLASSGVQTNGLTLCRKIAAEHPEGYLAKMTDGRSFGEGLLDPSVIYVDFVRTCQLQGVPLHYVAHVTGHGWRKLMRLAEPFVYRIDNVTEPLPVFQFIAGAAGLEAREMYGTYNMGVGFAAMVPASAVDAALTAARACGHAAWRAGTVVRAGERRAVEIIPLGITFDSDTLQLR